MTKLNEVFDGSDQKNERQETHSCCCGGGHQNHHLSNPEVKSVYQCPMKCEDDKTYSVPGNCPVCNMHLVPVNEVHQF
jgi:Cu2+-exporting ATPase